MNIHPARRRKPIFLGLLMLIVGILLLVHNLVPDLVHLGTLLLYWPVLLILWGLTLLWEYFAARRANQAPPRGIGGREFALILFLVAGSLALLAIGRARSRMNWPYRFGLFGNLYTFAGTLTSATLEPETQVLLWTPRGDISVRPHDSMNLNLVVTKSVRAPSQDAAQKIADATTVAVETTPQGVRVEPRTPVDGFAESVSYDATVPAKISLSVSTGRGGLHITGIDGQVSANASGEVDVSQIGSNVTLNMDHGNLRIHSVSGNVTVSGGGEQVDLSEISGMASLNGRFFGPIRIRRAGHGIQYKSPRTTLGVDAALGRLDMGSDSLQVSDTTGDLSLTTRNKDVRIENVQGSVQIHNRNGDVSIHCSQPPRGAIEITDRSGSINLYLPGRSAFSLKATALNGDISSAFQAPGLHLSEQGSNSSMQGSVGSGGPQIVLSTTYGTIRIMRTPPVPPMPPVTPATPPPPGI
jgi:Toastrack DUF4097